jgi:hypothetical protein
MKMVIVGVSLLLMSVAALGTEFDGLRYARLGRR